ncbi:type II toxin-antitoxin system RelE/ParE family toxin [Burkholderia gladioli]|uniref:type II toxin-antitoxin system RelE/ParE family toxin n=1 Tax=Burkholderia gladioli TaxID=28095 RepID=UPI001640004D|nr:type II toxin-antitoxin system RelE/ParE family toxin [Burkholderia gladioli]
MIQSFRCKRTAALFAGESPPAWRAVVQVARRKLAMLDAAQALRDLAVPPGNQLEGLFGDRAGQYSIRINERWRLCLVWSSRGPELVEIVDYH